MTPDQARKSREKLKKDGNIIRGVKKYNPKYRNRFFRDGSSPHKCSVRRLETHTHLLCTEFRHSTDFAENYTSSGYFHHLNIFIYALFPGFADTDFWGDPVFLQEGN
jgi:hypothetical protein